MYAIITENDQSKWNDITGVRYHFPPQYRKHLSTGTKFIYYKGRIKDKKFTPSRLSDQPHYFGKGTINKIIKETNSKDYQATIVDYVDFGKAIPFKAHGKYLETIPATQQTNYFRISVRPISEETYNKIIQLVDVITEILRIQQDDELTTTVPFREGGKKLVYTTRYERNKELREEAIRLQGYNCKCCEVNFKDKYGKLGEGFIHVHHKKPISTTNGIKDVDPLNDLDVVCPNCHSMLHKPKNRLLTVEELKAIIQQQNH